MRMSLQYSLLIGGGVQQHIMHIEVTMPYMYGYSMLNSLMCIIAIFKTILLICLDCLNLLAVGNIKDHWNLDLYKVSKVSTHRDPHRMIEKYFSLLCYKYPVRDNANGYTDLKNYYFINRSTAAMGGYTKVYVWNAQQHGQCQAVETSTVTFEKTTNAHLCAILFYLLSSFFPTLRRRAL